MEVSYQRKVSKYRSDVNLYAWQSEDGVVIFIKRTMLFELTQEAMR